MEREWLLVVAVVAFLAAMAYAVYVSVKMGGNGQEVRKVPPDRVA
jgi:hypothetical protein